MWRRALLLGMMFAVAGCGRHQEAPASGKPLTLEDLDARRDTSGLSQGAAIVRSFEPYRLPNGLIRARGELGLPDDTVLQLVLSRPGERWPITRVQFTLRNRHFDTPPMIGPKGPLPAGVYRFELMTFFDPEWQPAGVLRATGDGRDLRGPGITRDAEGHAAFDHIEEHRL